MVLAVDNVSKKKVATVHNRGRMEIYECNLSTCANPVCACGIVYLDLIPKQAKHKNKDELPVRKVEIDIDKKSLGYKDRKQVPEENLKFAELFLREMDENDFQILYKSHFAIKNKISEEASPDSIDAVFDYHEVEYNGLMSAYNDVLPYGDQLQVKINGRQCLVLDQYCLLPKCPCTDTTLNIMVIDEVGNAMEDLCAISLNYRKKKWELIEEYSIPLNLKTVRSSMEDQFPDIYKRLQTRHTKLKAIYAHCKKMYYSTNEKLQLPKVGRNDPCPCGSGKKYKKCCLRKSN